MSKQNPPPIGVLAIGDELSEGRIPNNNACWVARRYGDTLMLTVGDREPDVLAALKFLNRCAVVIVTGGIGPTVDDLTRNFVCRYLKCGLSVHRPTLEKIRRKMAAFGRAYFSANNEIQASYPAAAHPIENDIGGAVGFRFNRNGTRYFFLPGVPREFEHMVNRHIAPFLRRKDRPAPAVFHFSEIFESALDEALQSHLPPKLRRIYGIYPSVRGVEVIARAGTAADLREFQWVVKSTLSERLVYEGADAPEERLIAVLRRRKLNVSAAESCTAGLFMAMLARVPGASAVLAGGCVSYSNDVKVSDLGVRRETLKNHGAVSGECAAEMACGALKRYRSNVAVSITGIAGPDGGTPDKPVGTVYFGFIKKWGRVEIDKRILNGTRNDIREKSVYHVIHRLIRRLS